MKKSNSKRPSTSNTNVDYDEVKRKLNQGNLRIANEEEKPQKKGPTKSQINRLKQLYNTTRWLPNSAFTTYFGKPAFENYGYGNTNPVYGGLFYGNYMLSHNMNPIDGPNHPPEKQVYSSAMMKSCQRKGIRRPSPPRKIPDEIRNTPEELKEIRTRKQIFQLPNDFPAREIVPPNLLKCRYFRSGKNSPAESENEDEDEYEVWNVENVLSGKQNKKKKINAANKGGNAKYNPYKQGKVELGKKKMKEGLDNKVDEGIYKKTRDRKARRLLKDKQGDGYISSDEKDDYDEEYERKKMYYEQLLGEEALNNIEDLSNLKVKNEEQEHDNMEQQQQQEQQQYEEQQLQQHDVEMNNKCACPHCNTPLVVNSCEKGHVMLKKKENPALMPKELTKQDNKEAPFICCMHHSKQEFDIKEKDPRSYTGMPPCTMAGVAPAGRPVPKSKPLNLFG